MAVEIAKLYNRGGVGLLEAGTGVGKSLGYLVPALRWAAANNERTIVSTNTINLQEQLVRKDLPFLAKALGDQPVRFALLKGWRNYLCLHAARAGALVGQRAVRGRPAAGARRDSQCGPSARSDGSLSDLTMTPRAGSVGRSRRRARPLPARALSAVRASASCSRRARRRRRRTSSSSIITCCCPISRCGASRATGAKPPCCRRTRGSSSTKDIISRTPPSTHLGSTVSRRSLQRLFNRLDRRGKGLLSALIMRLSSSNDLLSTASLDLVGSRLSPAVHAAAREGDAAVRSARHVPAARAASLSLRLTDSFADASDLGGGTCVSRSRTRSARSSCSRKGSSSCASVSRAERIREDAVMPLLNEMRSVARRLQSAGDGLKRALDPGPAPRRFGGSK